MGGTLVWAAPRCLPSPPRFAAHRVVANGGPLQGPVLQAQPEGNTSGVEDPSQGRGQPEHCGGYTGVLSPGQDSSVSCKQKCQSR